MVLDWHDATPLSTNRLLLKWLEAEAELARPAGMALGGYELHAHPDLVDRVVECTEGVQVDLVAAFGIPCVATTDSVIVAFARGTSVVFVRGVTVASPVRLDGLDPGWGGIDAFFPPEWKDMPLEERLRHKEEGQRRLLLHIGELLERASGDKRGGGAAK